ncbi:MAG: hypothetical protein RLZ42_142, partial [Armatimonadota bacterium]
MLQKRMRLHLLPSNKGDQITEKNALMRKHPGVSLKVSLVDKVNTLTCNDASKNAC